jgi:hypothetical protein
MHRHLEHAGKERLSLRTLFNVVVLWYNSNTTLFGRGQPLQLTVTPPHKLGP